MDIIYAVKPNSSGETKFPHQTLLVQFSELSDDYQDLDAIQKLSSKDLFKDRICHWDDKGKLSRVDFEVDVTNQVLMVAGTIWKNGYRVWEPSEFLNITVSQKNKQIASYQSFKSNGIELPFAPYPVQGSSFLKLPNCKIFGEEKVTVLIPSTELIRYYFSGSKFFTMLLYNSGLEYIGGIQSPTVYRYDRMDGTDDCYIWLRRRCYDSDAILLARGIKDHNAMKAMKYVSASINAQRKYGKNMLYPKTNFPFSDETELEVFGQWLKPDNNGKFTTYLVRSINKCHHSLPFNHLTIESIDSYRTSPFKKNSKPENKEKLGGFEEELSEANLTHDEPPTELIDTKEFEFALERTPDLLNILIEKVNKASETETRKLIEIEESDDIETESDSTLPGNSKEGNNIQSWDMKVSSVESIPVDSRLKVVSETVYKLEQELEISVNIPLNDCCLDGSEPYGFYLFEKPDSKDRGYQWHTVDARRRRRALFLKLSNKLGYEFYLLEIEGKDKETFALYLLFDINESYSPGLFHHSRANTLLQEIAERSGKRFISNVLKKHFKEVKSVQHKYSQAETFETKLYRILRAYFD